MGAVRMRVQTADKNITIIHSTPVHQLTSWEDKSCVFVLHWWASVIMLHFWWRNNLIYILDGMRVCTFWTNVHFWVNYFFKIYFPRLFQKCPIINVCCLQKCFSSHSLCSSLSVTQSCRSKSSCCSEAQRFIGNLTREVLTISSLLSVSHTHTQQMTNLVFDLSFADSLTLILTWLTEASWSAPVSFWSCHFRACGQHVRL